MSTRIYACRGGACNWRGSIDHMPVIKCPKCGSGYLEFDAIELGEADEDAGRTIFSSPRVRNRESEMKKKTQPKRPGMFERVAGKLFFRRS